MGIALPTLNCVSMAGGFSLVLVVSANARPIRDRPLGHFLESGLLYPPQAALRRFPSR